jgi:hypothetical protein
MYFCMPESLHRGPVFVYLSLETVVDELQLMEYSSNVESSGATIGIYNLSKRRTLVAVIAAAIN